MEYTDINNLLSEINSHSPISPCEHETQYKIGFDKISNTDISESISVVKSGYLLDYIKTIDDDVLSEHSIDRDELKAMTIEYYNRAEGVVNRK